MSDDSPWKDRPAYLDVGYSGGRHFGGVGTGGDDWINPRGRAELDLVEDKRMDEGEVSMKSLVVWPLLALAVVVFYSYRPSSTEPAQAAPVVATVQAASAPNLIPPAPPAVTNPTPRGHWVWIPENAPNLPPGWSIPPAAPNH